MLDREAILGAFERLAALLRERGVEGEVCLHVDAIFQPASLVRELARTVAAERELPEDWLNDGAKGVIGLRSPAEALGIVSRYYSEDLVPPRAVYLLEDLFAAKERRP